MHQSSSHNHYHYIIIVTEIIHHNFNKMFILHFCIESPARVTLQVPNNQVTIKKESSGHSSPQPPPRGRNNPFNKPVNSHQSPQRKDIVSFRKTFKELHNQLGRPILRDRNEWRFGLMKQELNTQEPLITL